MNPAKLFSLLTSISLGYCLFASPASSQSLTLGSWNTEGAVDTTNANTFTINDNTFSQTGVTVSEIEMVAGPNTGTEGNCRDETCAASIYQRIARQAPVNGHAWQTGSVWQNNLYATSDPNLTSPLDVAYAFYRFTFTTDAPVTLNELVFEASVRGTKEAVNFYAYGETIDPTDPMKSNAPRDVIDTVNDSSTVPLTLLGNSGARIVSPDVFQSYTISLADSNFNEFTGTGAVYFFLVAEDSKVKFKTDDNNIAIDNVFFTGELSSTPVPEPSSIFTSVGLIAFGVMLKLGGKFKSKESSDIVRMGQLGQQNLARSRTLSLVAISQFCGI